MPAETTSGSVLKGRVNSAHLAKHAKDRIDSTGGGLPEGIEGGVAQLTQCGFALYKTGKHKDKPYFYVQGTVQEPVTFITPNGTVKVQGRVARAQIQYFASDNRSEEEQAAKIMAHLRWIGGDTFCDDVKTDTDLEKKAATLQRLKPYFRFRTWKGKKQQPTDPEPQVQVSIENSGDLAGYKAPKAPGSGVKDNGAANGSTTGTRNQSGGNAQTTGEQFDEFANDANNGYSDSTPDYEQMGRDAGSGDEEVKLQLKELAEKYGVLQEFTDATGWEEAALIVARAHEESEKGAAADEPGGDDEPASEPEEKPMPVIGQVWQWFYVKDGKPTKTPMKVLVKKVDITAETIAAVKVGDPKKSFAKIPFAELEPLPE